jgi:hypothetical protein
MPVGTETITVDIPSVGTVAGEGLEDEHLDGEVGVDVVVAHERDDSSPCELLHGGDRVGLHRVLKCASAVLHDLVLAVLHEGLLAFGEGGAQDSHDDVRPDRGARSCWPAAGVLVQQADDRVRDRCGKHASSGYFWVGAGHSQPLCLLSP